MQCGREEAVKIFDLARNHNHNTSQDNLILHLLLRPISHHTVVMDNGHDIISLSLHGVMLKLPEDSSFLQQFQCTRFVGTLGVPLVYNIGLMLIYSTFRMLHIYFVP